MAIPLLIPVYQNGQVGQIAIQCSTVEPLGKPGILRIKRKRGKWVADGRTRFRTRSQRLIMASWEWTWA